MPCTPAISWVSEECVVMDPMRLMNQLDLELERAVSTPLVSKVKVKNLFHLGGIEETASDALSIEQCKAWCYSNIVCQYWQFSQVEGCFVDAPMLSKRTVPYPLTTASLLENGDSSNIIAGEYIHHYCPNRTMADVDDGYYQSRSRVPANMAMSSANMDGPRVWPWVLVQRVLLQNFFLLSMRFQLRKDICFSF